MITENPKFLKILIIATFAVVIPVSIVGINFFEKTVTTHVFGKIGLVNRWKNLHLRIKMIR